MSTTVVSLEERMRAACSPRREYVNGVVVERHVGERLQALTGYQLTAPDPAVSIPLNEVFRGL